MFRYIGFSWHAADPNQDAMAQRLDLALQTNEEWQPALNQAGLRVYTAGGARGVNGIYPLPAAQGVILGRLFRRRTPSTEPGDIEITTVEAQRIVQSEGRALIEEFWGRYVAFLPSWTGEARVLRDPTGTLPCYRIEMEGVAVVFSWLEDLLSLQEIPAPVVNWAAVAAHMLFGRLGGRETALEGVTQILAGELAAMSSHASPAQTLWSAVAVARQAPVDDKAVASKLLNETTWDCVRSWASCYESILLRLSGGVDSSLLLGNLRRGMPPERITCVNYHSAGSDSDERRYARLAAQRAGVELVERSLDESFRVEQLLGAARTPTPSNYFGGMGSRNTDAEIAAAHDASAIFTGAAGDQIFFEYRSPWPAADYLKLRGFDRGFLHAALDSAHLGRISFWQAVRRAITDQGFRGNPIHGAGHLLTLVRAEAMESAADTAQRFIHPAALHAAELPIGKFHQVNALICPLEYHNPFRSDAAPPLVHPFISQPLLEAVLSIPTYILTWGGQGRGLARMTFADVLPPAIAGRRSKGGMEEYTVRMLQSNLGFARELLLEGHLSRRGLLDRHRVEAALSGRPSATAAYVTEIHASIATELWVRRFEGSSSAARS